MALTKINHRRESAIGDFQCAKLENAKQIRQISFGDYEKGNL